MIYWQPIETAPWGEEVLLTGESGYHKPHDRFIINGYRVKDWHQGEWNDATGTHAPDASAIIAAKDAKIAELISENIEQQKYILSLERIISEQITRKEAPK